MDTKASAIWAIPFLAVLIVGCSNGPTAPSSTTSENLNAGVSTTPAPPPTPGPAPSPTPAPPAPAPAPAPPGPPAPVPLATYAAVTGSAHWYTMPPLLPERFTVDVYEQTVSFGPLRLPITTRNKIGEEVFGIIAADQNVTVVLERGPDSWRWSLGGLAGQAFGYMTVQ